MKNYLKDGGKYIAINGSPAQWLWMIVERITGLPVQGDGYELFLLTPTTQSLEQVGAWFDEGKLAPTRIDSTFVVDSDQSLRDAFSRMKSRRTVGKIILTMK